MLKIGYKDTEQQFKVDIYGLIFDVNKNELEKIDTKDIKDDTNMDEILEKVLGEGSVNRINEKREEEGYNKIGNGEGIAILAAIVDEYVKNTMKPIEKMANNYQRRNDNFYRKFNRNRNYRYRR